MAKKEELKDLNQEQEILLTEEEFARRQRKKNRENINRVTRIIGMIAIFAIVVMGIIPTFVLSLFGLIFTRKLYIEAWHGIAESGAIKAFSFMMGHPGVYYEGDEWLGTVFMTAILIAVILGMIYLLTYNIADLIQFFKAFYRSTKDLVIDIKDVAKDSLTESSIQLKKKKDKKIKADAAEDNKDEKSKDLFKDEPLVVEKKEEKRRKAPKADSSSPTGQYTSEQLDRLLRGESLEEPSNNEDQKPVL